MEDLRDYLDLFGLSMAASLLVAPVLAAVGALLQLRREAFLGVAVPQFATAGVALGLCLLPLFPPVQASFLEHGHPPMVYLLPFAAGAAILTLLAYGLRGGGTPNPSLLAGGFALAGAFAIVFLHFTPSGSNYADTMLRGDVLYLDQHDFGALAAVCVAGAGFLWLSRRTLLIGAIDPEQAAALHLPLRAVQGILPVVLGAVIGCGVMTLGPILVFSLLFLPPLAAAASARNLKSYLALSMALSLLMVVLAWVAAILANVPYGPAAGVSGGMIWLASLLLRRRSPGIPH